MATAGRGATGPTLPTTGGRDERHGYGQPDQELAAQGLLARANRIGLRVDHLRYLAPDTADLAGAVSAGARRLGRPAARANPAALRRDPARVVRKGAAEATSRTRKKLETGRRTRLAPGTCPRLAGWLHRSARVHAHLCAIIRLYGNPSKAGGQSNQGETYAARAARGDRTLLYDAIGLSIDELVEIRDEIQVVIDSAPPTQAAPGTVDKVAEMARRAERGESLFIEGDGPRPGDGSPGG